jgi:Cu+-exporting ATPase
MHCAACSSAVERVTRKLPGVVRSDVNLTTNKMDIEYDEKQVTPGQIREKIEKAGFGASLHAKEKRKAAAGAPEDDEQKAFVRERNGIIAALILSAVLLYVSMGAMMFGAPLPGLLSMETHVVNFAAVQMLLTVVIIFIGKALLYERLQGAVAPKPQHGFPRRDRQHRGFRLQPGHLLPADGPPASRARAVFRIRGRRSDAGLARQAHGSR